MSNEKYVIEINNKEFSESSGMFSLLVLLAVFSNLDANKLLEGEKDKDE